MAEEAARSAEPAETEVAAEKTPESPAKKKFSPSTPEEVKAFDNADKEWTKLWDFDEEEQDVFYHLVNTEFERRRAERNNAATSQIQAASSSSDQSGGEKRRKTLFRVGVLKITPKPTASKLEDAAEKSP